MDKELRDFLDRICKSEAQLENYFARKVEEAGGWAVKFNSVGTNGLPDRIVFFSGFTWLVELKWKRGVVQPHQVICHKRFKKYGFKVRIVRTKEEVRQFVDDMQNLIF